MTGARGANFFGRSMIEMLGVLAIIGVLSVGGIAGYSKAMEKYKINKTISAVAQIALNIKNLYAEQTNYYGLGVVGGPNREVLNIVVPSDMRDYSVAYAVRHPLNGQLAIYATGRHHTETTKTYTAFAISIKGLNKRACAEIVVRHRLLYINVYSSSDYLFARLRAKWSSNTLRMRMLFGVTGNPTDRQYADNGKDSEHFYHTSAKGIYSSTTCHTRPCA